MTVDIALTKLQELDAYLHAMGHAIGVLRYDGETVAPKKSSKGRGDTLGVLSGLYFKALTAPENPEIFATVLAGGAEVSQLRRRQAEELQKQYMEIALMPAEEYSSWQQAINEANDVWHDAKQQDDFALFAPHLEKMVAYNRRLAELKDASKPAYDVLLDSYEKQVTTSQLDVFFATLRSEIVPLIHAISEKPNPELAFTRRIFPVEGQKKLSDRLMEIMGIDRERCAIGETEHPFTDGNNRDDVRITTHYYEDAVLSSMFSVIHEGGHALYELNVSPELAGTCLCSGSSMALHESQSRFYENIIGRSEAFCQLVLPEMQKIFPEKMGDVGVEDLYRALNRVEPSLIRTEADELTYSLHVMVRYELEKQLFAGTLQVKDLPEAWNALYKEYLGVNVPNYRTGCLQDSHWAGAAFGYFPSYALGSAYGAQMLAAMRKEFDPFAQVAQGKLQPVTDWLASHVHRHGMLLEPKQILQQACGADFDPRYYTAYLKTKYTALYNL